VGVFAYDEASKLAHRGIALIGRQTASPQLLALELGLQLILGSCAAVQGGYAAAAAMSAMERARALAEELGNVPQLSPALWGLHAYYLVSGRIPKSLEVAERALAIASEHQGEMALMTAHTDMAIALRFMGRFEEAIEHFDSAVAVYDPAKQLEYHAAYHMDPGVFCLAEFTRALWAAGYVDRAIDTLNRVIDLARKSPDPRTLAFAMLMGSVLHHLLREPDNTLPYSEEGIELADEHQIIQERAWLTTSLGWAHAMLGKVDQGIIEVETSLAMRRRMNAELDIPYALTQLAEAYSLRGDITRARATLQEAIEVSNRNSDLWALSEIYRWLGDLALRRENGGYDNEATMSDVDRREAAEVRNSAAEAHYFRALEIAHEQGARSFELRAAVSLGKVMESEERVQEAIDLVAPLRGFFDGQRATPDSIDADMLLSRLRNLAASRTQ
ncbi:MAG TPA: tetratricopeptide repeat protein, partial [Gemmatimonadaceae bacterium]|nr:tetratricopeptide repeat protein [Gemmatimonadaceae bacterium]